MTVAKKLKENEIPALELSQLIIDSMQATKAHDIVQLDLRDIPEAPADFFIVCSGQSVTQVKAIANNLQKTLKEEHQTVPNHTEGQSTAQWILVDFFDVVVHIFHPETREFYEIEHLWGDAKKTSFPSSS